MREQTEPASGPPAGELSDEDKDFLVCLARQTLESYLTDRTVPALNPAALSDALRRQAACFVTLYRDGDLRGCMGTTVADEPLYESVIHCAVSAATCDHRFPAVAAPELRYLALHVSVLTPFHPLEHKGVDDLLAQLVPGTHGVLMRGGWRSALYLPQVWDHFGSDDRAKAAFLTSLSHKAGDPSGTLWKQPGTRFEVFEAIGFGEYEEQTGP